MFFRVFVKPMVKRTETVGGMDVDGTWEASLKAREDIVER